MEKANEQSISNIELIPVILSGGSGSRLWPLSRSSYPKQYLNLHEKNNFSLLQNTYLRLKGLNNLKDPIIITNEEQRFIVSEQMREIDVTPNSILLEPMGKNTAPAVTLATLKALEDFKGKECKIGRARMFAEKSKYDNEDLHFTLGTRTRALVQAHISLV